MENNRGTQRDRILSLLQRKHDIDISTGRDEEDRGWVPLPEILDLRIGQYNSRILELRRSGHSIECKIENSGRQRHTSYRLVL